MTLKSSNSSDSTGLWAVVKRSILQIVRRPIYWVTFIFFPLLFIIMLTSLMDSGLPVQTPAAIIDKDGTSMSRQLSQTLSGMQMVDIVADCDSYTSARKKMQEGEIYGFFMIPENYQADLLAGRAPVITYYTNMTYYVPASLLYKTFKTTAMYTKAGVALQVVDAVGGASMGPMDSVLLPVNVTARALGNPWLDYAVYLCNSFLPCVLQFLILVTTAFSIGEEVKYRTSLRLMQLSRGSIYRAIFGKLLPQTIIWIVIAFFMESWLYKWMGYPMNGSWGWLTLSEVMFVLATQGLAIFFYGLLPNLRLSLSVCSLLGILSFSIAAFSFPVESMYGAIGIFSWMMPIRYNFLIYIDQVLNGRDIFYSRIWYVIYIVYMLLPLTVMWSIKKQYQHPVYVP